MLSPHFFERDFICNLTQIFVRTAELVLSSYSTNDDAASCPDILSSSHCLRPVWALRQMLSAVSMTGHFVHSTEQLNLSFQSEACDINGPIILGITRIIGSFAVGSRMLWSLDQ